MRHFIAGGLLLVLALAVTFGIATMLQNRATTRSMQQQDYTPPALKGPGGRSGENARVFMMSRRMNDDQVNERSEANSE